MDNLPQDLLQFSDSLTTIGLLITFAWWSLKREARQKEDDRSLRVELATKLEAREAWIREVLIEALVSNSNVLRSFNDHFAKFTGFVERTKDSCPLRSKEEEEENA